MDAVAADATTSFPSTFWRCINWGTMVQASVFSALLSCAPISQKQIQIHKLKEKCRRSCRYQILWIQKENAPCFLRNYSRSLSTPIKVPLQPKARNAMNKKTSPNLATALSASCSVAKTVADSVWWTADTCCTAALGKHILIVTQRKRDCTPYFITPHEAEGFRKSYAFSGQEKDNFVNFCNSLILTLNIISGRRLCSDHLSVQESWMTSQPC